MSNRVPVTHQPVIILQGHPVIGGSSTLNLCVVLRAVGVRVVLITNGHVESGCGLEPDQATIYETDPYCPRWLRGPAARALRFTQFTFSALRRCIVTRPSVIVATNYDTLAIAWLAALLVHTHVIYYIKEYTAPPDLRALLSGWGLIKLLERRLVKRADYIASVESWRASQQKKEWQVREPIDVVENAALRLDTVPPGRDPVVSVGVLRVVYAGRIAQNTCINELLEAVATSSVVSLSLAGFVHAAYKSEFEERLREAQRRNGEVTYCGLIPYLELNRFLSSFEVGVTLYRGNRLNERHCAPGKVYQYISVGLACIVPRFAGTCEFVDRHGFAVAVEPTSVNSIAAGLSEFGKREVLVQKRLAARAAHLGELNYEFQSRRLVERIGHWVRNSGPGDGASADRMTLRYNTGGSI